MVVEKLRSLTIGRPIFEECYHLTALTDDRIFQQCIAQNVVSL